MRPRTQQAEFRLEPVAPAGRQHDRDDWHNRAKCRGTDPEDYFCESWSDGTRFQGATLRALSVCAVCPVAKPCLTEALRPVFRIAPPTSVRSGELVVESPVLGVWAGTFPEDRTGASVTDVDDLLDLARSRAVVLGLAPADVLAEVS